jgi:hypothetical protein
MGGDAFFFGDAEGIFFLAIIGSTRSTTVAVRTSGRKGRGT